MTSPHDILTGLTQDNESDPDPLVGKQIGSYTIQRRIGAGGMGTVYAMQHPGIGKRLALKVLHHEYAKKPKIVKRFFDEARAVNLIQHPNIVDIIDFSRLPDGRYYISMEYLEGQPLDDFIAAESQVEPTVAAELLLPICSALHAAHLAGIVHRDLKPANIFLTRRFDNDRYVKVLDFGIAKLGDQSRFGSEQTRSGVVLGTPTYMSPEQAMGQVKKIDKRTDIYALGIIAYKMLTGRVPFIADSFGELLLMHLQKRPLPVTDLRPELSPRWNTLIQIALAKQREARFQSMAAFADAVEALQTAGPGLLETYEKQAEGAFEQVSSDGGTGGFSEHGETQDVGEVEDAPIAGVQDADTLYPDGDLVDSELQDAHTPAGPRQGRVTVLLADLALDERAKLGALNTLPVGDEDGLDEQDDGPSSGHSARGDSAVEELAAAGQAGDEEPAATFPGGDEEPAGTGQTGDDDAYAEASDPETSGPEAGTADSDRRSIALPSIAEPLPTVESHTRPAPRRRAIALLAVGVVAVGALVALLAGAGDETTPPVDPPGSADTTPATPVAEPATVPMDAGALTASAPASSDASIEVGSEGPKPAVASPSSSTPSSSAQPEPEAQVEPKPKKPRSAASTPRTKPRATATIRIGADPWAQIRVNGRTRGTTPLEVTVQAGKKVRIVLTNPEFGNARKRYELTLEPNAKKDIFWEVSGK